MAPRQQDRILLQNQAVANLLLVVVLYKYIPKRKLSYHKPYKYTNMFLFRHMEDQHSPQEQKA